MKKLEYKSAKWDKLVDFSISNNEIEYRRNEIEEVKEIATDKIHEQMLYRISYILLAKCEYINKEYKQSIDSWSAGITHLINAFNLEGKVETNEASKIRLEEFKSGCGEVYIAYVMNRFDELSSYMINSDIEYYLSDDEDEYLYGMYLAVKEGNQQKFDLFLTKRIKEIRKFSVDYLVVVDFWALSLVKFALEHGIKNSIKVIELGYTEGGNNVFI
jgi:hypothetical protein